MYIKQEKLQDTKYQIQGGEQRENMVLPGKEQIATIYSPQIAMSLEAERKELTGLL